MIQIHKRGVAVPSILSNNGVDAAYAHTAAYNAGTRRFIFNNAIYGHLTVKKTLIRLQHDKCCFCERKVSAGEPGHIEHYRPKGGYKSSDGTPLTRPGYYWLAYNFDNLYYSCNRCNTSYKKNYFPLSDETQRASNHTLDISNEDPLIMNPSIDARPYLMYQREKIKARGGQIKGRETIKRTGLNRNALLGERLEYLKLLDTLAAVARGGGPESNEAKAHFRRISQNNALFSYMVVCNYPDLVE